MPLYRINGAYPDVDFNWNASAEAYGFAGSAHQHTEADVDNLAAAMADKAPADHTHDDYIQGVIVGGETLTGTIDVLGGGNLDASISEDLLLLDRVVSDPGGGVSGMLNANPARRHATVKLATQQVALAPGERALVFAPESV